MPPWVPRSALLLQPNVTRLRRVNTLTPLSRTRGKLSLRSNKFSHEHKRGDLPIHKHAGAHETSSWTSFLLSSFRKNLPTNLFPGRSCEMRLPLMSQRSAMRPLSKAHGGSRAHFRHLRGSILSALAWQTCREWAAHEPKRKDRVRRAQRGSSFSPHAIDEKTIASDSAWPPPPGSPHPPFTLHHQPWVLSGVQVPP